MGKQWIPGPLPLRVGPGTRLTHYYAGLLNYAMLSQGPDKMSKFPDACKIEGFNYPNALSLGETNKTNIHSIDDVLSHQPKTTAANAGKLVALLAQECVFGGLR